MWQSQVIKGWKEKVSEDLRREGELKRQRETLLTVLHKRFEVEVPADLVQTIQHMTDLETLSRWFDAALDTPSLEAFRSHLQTSPPPPATPPNP